MTLTFGSLFAGVGGFDRGFEMAGLRCLWQVEIDAKCRQVLAGHWPDVQRWEDVRDVGQHNLNQLTLFVGGSRVNRSLTQVCEMHRMMLGGYGPSFSESFANYDRDSSSWKTCQVSWEGDLRLFSGTLPKSGMMRNGKLYRRRRLAPHRFERESLLWPTPTKSDAMRLRFSIESLTKRYHNPHKRGGQAILNEELAAMFGCSPTPIFYEWLMGFPLNWTLVEYLC